MDVCEADQPPEADLASALFRTRERAACDAVRNASVWRYFIGRRTGGDTSDMGWGSEAACRVFPFSPSTFFAFIKPSTGGNRPDGRKGANHEGRAAGGDN